MDFNGGAFQFRRRLGIVPCMKDRVSSSKATSTATLYRYKARINNAVQPFASHLGCVVLTRSKAPELVNKGVKIERRS